MSFDVKSVKKLKKIKHVGSWGWVLNLLSENVNSKRKYSFYKIDYITFI